MSIIEKKTGWASVTSGVASSINSHSFRDVHSDITPVISSLLSAPTTSNRTLAHASDRMGLSSFTRVTMFTTLATSLGVLRPPLRVRAETPSMRPKNRSRTSWKRKKPEMKTTWNEHILGNILFAVKWQEKILSQAQRWQGADSRKGAPC